MKNLHKALLFQLVGLFLPALAFGQEVVERRDLTTEDMMMTATLTMAGFTILLIGVLIFLLLKLRTSLKQLLPASAEDMEYEAQDFWSKVFQLRPISAEKRLVMEHSYDGIQELDNPTPPWFMFLFYSTILFAVVYGIVYHAMGDGKIMENEYAAEVKDAEIIRAAYLKKFANSINENNVVLLTDKAKLLEGKTLYDNNCVACHGAAGEGKVGPNLTDEYWVHGSGIKKIFHTITEGVPEKGMIAWKKQLNPLQIQQVSSYIVSLKGTHPANAKAPQGEPETAEVPADTSATKPAAQNL